MDNKKILKKETKPVVKNLLKQKNDIAEQLKLLSKYRDIPEVQEYIDYISKEDSATPYVLYLIDKYYYNKKDLVEPEKTGLELWGNLILE